jgi:hypothetical protein
MLLRWRESSLSACSDLARFAKSIESSLALSSLGFYASVIHVSGDGINGTW